MFQSSVAPKFRILVVDDEEGVREIFARMLALNGYETQTASSADAALEMLEEFRPAGIFLDLTMPYVNGLGFLYRLREVNVQVPVTVITGRIDLGQQTLEELSVLGATVRFKPLSLDDVQAAASEMMRFAVERT